MFYTYCAYGVAGALGLSLVYTGLRFLVAPRRATMGYGVPLEQPHTAPTDAYLAAKGVRDIAAGVVLMLLILFQTPRILGWALVIATLIPLVDAYIVRTYSTSKAFAYGVHAVLATGMLATAVLLLAVPA